MVELKERGASGIKPACSDNAVVGLAVPTRMPPLAIDELLELPREPLRTTFWFVVWVIGVIGRPP